MSILIDRGLLDKYPIDISVLAKGDVIDKSTLERITAKTIDDNDWQFSLLSLKEWIEKQSKENGCRLIPRIVGQTILIQTDEQAAKYTDRQATLGRRRFYRNHRRQLDVETKNLTDEARNDHMQSVVLNGRMIANMHSRRVIPEPKPHNAEIPLFKNNEAT